MADKKLLLILVVDPASFLLFRVPIAQAAAASGYEVHVAGGPSAASAAVEQLGFTYHELPLNRSGANPLREITAVWAILGLLRALRPDVLHLVTIKPVLYGGIAARLAGTGRVIAAVSGLGRTFIAGGLLASLRRTVVTILYRLSFRNSHLVAVFQNEDDRAVINGLVGADRFQSRIIEGGSGVNLSNYAVEPEPPGRGTVLFVGRLLIDKGIGEFVEAAGRLRRGGANFRFVAIGSVDAGNPASLSQADVDRLAAEGNVEFPGYSDNIPAALAGANLVCLPSYREGFPKVLIEAAACGRATVTTDVPGCRDAIIPDVTGLLVQPQSAIALAEAIALLMGQPELRGEMGRQGRILAEAKFDVRRIVDEHLRLY